MPDKRHAATQESTLTNPNTEFLPEYDAGHKQNFKCPGVEVHLIEDSVGGGVPAGRSVAPNQASLTGGGCLRRSLVDAAFHRIVYLLQ